jgi:spermidine/putrescine transport system permease protein
VNRKPGLLSLIFVSCVFVFLYAPMIVLVVLSFNSAKRGSEWAGFTLDWYSKLFNNPPILESFQTSIEIAVLAAALSCLLGLCVGYTSQRGSKRSKPTMMMGIYLPIVLPEIVIGLSLLSFFVWLGIPMGRTSIVLAHASFGTAYVATLVRNRLLGLEPMLEDAAKDLGATDSQVFFKVIFPQLIAPLMAGAVMVFTLSFDDYIVSFFMAGVGVTTLPLKVYSMLKFGVTPEINALCALILCMSIFLVVSSLKIQKSLQES